MYLISKATEAQLRASRRTAVKAKPAPAQASPVRPKEAQAFPARTPPKSQPKPALTTPSAEKPPRPQRVHVQPAPDSKISKMEIENQELKKASARAQHFQSKISLSKFKLLLFPHPHANAKAKRQVTKMMMRTMMALCRSRQTMISAMRMMKARKLFKRLLRESKGKEKVQVLATKLSSRRPTSGATPPRAGAKAPKSSRKPRLQQGCHFNLYFPTHHVSACVCV